MRENLPSNAGETTSDSILKPRLENTKQMRNEQAYLQQIS